MESKKEWDQIGTVVGNASPIEFTFILKSFKSRVGDFVAVMMEVPSDDYKRNEKVCVWGRITSMDRFNPFFPFEAAQELSSESIALKDTILSESRDQLQAMVLVLGMTLTSSKDPYNLLPLTYPVQPAAEVYYPPAAAIKALLGTGIPGHTPLNVGSLIARDDVEVNLSADRIVSRHMAILAMTGGGKTVAARRILRELIDIGYPIVIFDPHGDYVGLWEKKDLFPRVKVRLLFPFIRMTENNAHLIEELIQKMTEGLTEPQKDILSKLLQLDGLRPRGDASIVHYLDNLIKAAEGWMRQGAEEGGSKKEKSEGGERAGRPTVNAVRRTLTLIHKRLVQMETTNERLRNTLKHLKFEGMPDPEGNPEGFVRPSQVSILYLGGYDHLTQSTIVSIVMESLFEHRASMSGRIPPFQTVIEEAHNFIPSGSQGREETPS
ncbi:MAG: ATP-binding protein, partial [Candidatus Omnitrophota bacterium]